jgi:hypothetical protein
LGGAAAPPHQKKAAVMERRYMERQKNGGFWRVNITILQRCKWLGSNDLRKKAEKKRKIRKKLVVNLGGFAYCAF